MNIVFDIDGTLANPAHRLHLIRPDLALSCFCFVSMLGCPRHDYRSDYDAFHDLCHLDPPIPVMIRLAQRLISDNGNHVEFWTGRPERVRAATSNWLNRYGLGGAPTYMRADGDRQEDTALKENWLAYTTYRPDLVFEDRSRVVAMYRSAGILCLQPVAGDY